MKSVGVRGYRRKTKEQLLKEIDACKSLSQLFALIQHEGIVLRMYSQPGASNLTPKKLYPKEIIDNKEDTPFERLRIRVRKAVEQYDEEFRQMFVLIAQKQGNFQIGRASCRERV